MVALCVASHYRNTPNDLLLMADAPAHRLFVLLGPVDDTVNALPDILAVVQVRARYLSLGLAVAQFPGIFAGARGRHRQRAARYPGGCLGCVASA